MFNLEKGLLPLAQSQLNITEEKTWQWPRLRTGRDAKCSKSKLLNAAIKSDTAVEPRLLGAAMFIMNTLDTPPHQRRDTPAYLGCR